MKISIIVPIYNVSKYLRRCLDSIMRQTYKNIEIILVNDGSTDDSLDICKKYEEIEKRIILINKLNGGLSDARNAGLKIASGHYIAFVDSDDWIEDKYIERLAQTALVNDADLVACGYRQVNSETSEPMVINKKLLFESSNMMVELSPLNMDDFFMKGKSKFSNVAWNKLYKKEIIKENNIKFMPNHEIFSEDILFNNSYFLFCKKLVLIEDVLYNYSIRKGSLMNISRPRLTEQLLNLAESYNEFVKKNNFQEIVKSYRDWIYCEMSLIAISSLSDYSIEKLKDYLKVIHQKDAYIFKMKRSLRISKNKKIKLRLNLITMKSINFSAIILSLLYKSKEFIRGVK